MVDLLLQLLVARHDCQACGPGIGGEARPLLAAALQGPVKAVLIADTAVERHVQ